MATHVSSGVGVGRGGLSDQKDGGPDCCSSGGVRSYFKSQSRASLNLSVNKLLKSDLLDLS